MASTGLKTYLNQFWPGLRPKPHWGSLQHPPDLILVGRGLPAPPQEPDLPKKPSLPWTLLSPPGNTPKIDPSYGLVTRHTNMA